MARTSEKWFVRDTKKLKSLLVNIPYSSHHYAAASFGGTLVNSRQCAERLEKTMKRVFITVLFFTISGAAMGYDLHIKESEKTVEQWVEYVENSKTLTLQDVAVAKNPKTGEVIQIAIPNSAIGKNGIYFIPQFGTEKLSITISKPRTEDIPYLKKIVAEFGGVLVGDEGETY